MPNDLIEPLEFFKIDKISDDVYAIAPNAILKFNVSLSKTSGGKRYHFHKEYEYPSKGIQNQPTLVTIKRSFDYYLSIENTQKDSKGDKAFIRIGPAEYMLLKKGIEEAISWFTDKKYSKLFAMNKGNLIIMPPIPEFSMSNLPMGKYIDFTPVVIDRGMSNADKEPGVRITLSNPSNFVDINLDRLMGLYYVVSTFNMYQSALSIVNYLQRPEFGTNRFIMEQNRANNFKDKPVKKSSSGIEGRFVTPEGTKDDIDKLEG